MRVPFAVVLIAAIVTSFGCQSARDGRVTLRFWAMGREGEVVQELVQDFERENPSIRVIVQQIPWTAAHEKLLTAHVGRSTPDLAQLGNTWIAEFAALNALEPLDSRIAASTTVHPASSFAGIWDTNVIDDTSYGIPWYVDTRVIFYRRDLLERAGYEGVPATWDDWRGCMERLKQSGAAEFGVFLPVNEWLPPVVLGLQAGSPLLRDHATRGAFSEPAFARAFDFYVALFQRGLAPPVRNNEIANLYQEFARGYFAMFITGPWNIGEFRRRMPPDLQDAWATAPLPGPDPMQPGVSVAGGSSLVLFRDGEQKDAAWRLVEFLSRPEQQVRFFQLTGDLPANVEAWNDSAVIADPYLRAFREQLEHVVATPKIPEWEQIAIRVQERAELAVRGGVEPDSVLALLDREVNRMLEKRRWLLEHRRGEAGARAS